MSERYGAHRDGPFCAALSARALGRLEQRPGPRATPRGRPRAQAGQPPLPGLRVSLRGPLAAALARPLDRVRDSHILGHRPLPRLCLLLLRLVLIPECQHTKGRQARAQGEALEGRRSEREESTCGTSAARSECRVGERSNPSRWGSPSLSAGLYRHRLLTAARFTDDLQIERRSHRRWHSSSSIRYIFFAWLLFDRWPREIVLSLSNHFLMWMRIRSWFYLFYLLYDRGRKRSASSTSHYQPAFSSHVPTKTGSVSRKRFPPLTDFKSPGALTAGLEITASPEESEQPSYEKRVEPSADEQSSGGCVVRIKMHRIAQPVGLDAAAAASSEAVTPSARLDLPENQSLSSLPPKKRRGKYKGSKRKNCGSDESPSGASSSSSLPLTSSS